jgi:hypothetical protein
MMILYHYTALEYLDAIMEEGLSKGDVPTSAEGGKTGVWLTTNRDSGGHGLSDGEQLASGHRVANKRAIRIAVTVPSSDRRLVSWMKWGRKHCEANFFDCLNRGGGGKHRTWYIYFGVIEPSRFSKNIEFLAGARPKIVLAQLPDGMQRVVYGSRRA